MIARSTSSRSITPSLKSRAPCLLGGCAPGPHRPWLPGGRARPGARRSRVELLPCLEEGLADGGGDGLELLGARHQRRGQLDDRVAAVVGHISTLSTLEIPILAQAGIPDVGMQSSGNAIDWTNPYVFPFVGGSTAAYITIPFAMKKLGKQRFVITYQDVPSAATNAKLARNAARVATTQWAERLAAAVSDHRSRSASVRKNRPGGNPLRALCAAHHSDSTEPKSVISGIA